MQAAKEKVKDMVSTAKEKVKEHKAKAEEKVEKAAARTHKEKEIAHEHAKAKVAEAKMEMHLEKAQHHEESAVHRASRLPLAGGHHRHHQPVGGAPVLPGNTAPTYPGSGIGPHELR